MAGTSTLQMINSIPKFDGTDYVEWSRSFNNILQISWPFLSKIVSGLEKHEPIPRSREKDPIEGGDYDTGYIDERGPSNVDDIKAWDSANEHLFSVLRLTTTGAARSVLLQFEPKYGRPGDGKQTWLALLSNYQNNSRQHRRTLFRHLDNSVMKPDTDPDFFQSEINQIRDELGVFDETVSTERLTTIILDALPAKIYSIVKLEAIRDPGLSLEQIQRMMRTIYINHSERLSVTKKNPESKRYQGSNRRGRETGRESAMSTALITCHYCKKPGHKVRDCQKLEREYEMEKSGKLNHEREKKWCIYHQINSHSDKQCYQPMGKSKKIKNESQKKWCSLHNSTTSHSNQKCFQQRSSSKCKDSSTVGKNSRKHETFVVDSTTVDCKSCCCSNGKIAKKSNEESEVEYSPPPGIGFSFACCHPPTLSLPSISLI